LLKLIEYYLVKEKIIWNFFNFFSKNTWQIPQLAV
jgi:hypothetical protein